MYSHGSSILQDPGNPDNLFIAMINHLKTGSVVELFDHEIGSNDLIHRETIKDSLLSSPNSIILISKNSFYATNDLKNKHGITRDFEMYLSLKTAHIVFYNGKQNKMKIVAENLQYANGISTNYDASLIYVAELTSPSLSIYERKSNFNLRFIEKLDVPMLIDNVWTDLVTGNVYAAGMLRPLTIKRYFDDPLNNIQPGVVVKIANTTGDAKFYGHQYTVEVVYQGNGKLIYSLA